MPRIGVGAPAFSSTGIASKLNDGGYKYDYYWSISGCSASTPCWNAIHIGSGPSSIIAQLSYESGSGMFSSSASVHAYSLMVSNDSTNGSDGTWVAATDMVTGQPVSLTGNTYIFRAHRIVFSGYSWIKLVVTSSGVSNIDELDMWDTSLSTVDGFFFHGDSITARCASRGTSMGWDEQPSFQALFTDHYPLMVNGGSVGYGADYADRDIGGYLAAFPMIQNWIFNFGTNDFCWSTPEYFGGMVQSWITKVKAAGKTPILVRPIWGNDVTDYCYQNGPAFNAVINGLVVSNDLLPAVQLYEGTYGHYEYFDTGDVHPNHDGCRAWNSIFANYVQTYLE